MAPKPPLPLRKPTPSSPSTTSHPPHKSSKAPTKRLKRSTKHATLLSRISKTAPDSKISKRRRPSKKLVTNLSGLADTLPETPNGANPDASIKAENETIIKHKSLKSRPGAGKKKEKLVAMEMERFGKNMALMAAGSGAERTALRDDQGRGREGGGKESSKERWAAIRGFISQTMDRRPD